MTFEEWKRELFGKPTVLDLIPAWKDRARRRRETLWMGAYLMGAGLSYHEAMNKPREAEEIFRIYQEMRYKLKHPRDRGPCPLCHQERLPS